MDYKATIAIPCYNKEKYLRRALDSIVEQSRFGDFEVIIVDDCSTDGSAAIVEDYAQRYENISLIVLDQPSGSPSKPRNTAIEASTTDYLIFMDPDDKIINDGYSTLLTKMEEYRSDVLIAARIGVNKEGVTEFTDFIDENFTYINENTDAIREDLLYRRPFILKTIYKKSLITENGLRFNERICTSEDESFDMRCIAYAKRVTKINDIVYQYTVESDGSITTKVDLRIYEELYDVICELADTYRLMFSDEVVADRLMTLMGRFYIQRISFFTKAEDIVAACNLVYETFDRFGYDAFEALTRDDWRELAAAIKGHDISRYVYGHLLWRMGVLNRHIGSLQKDLDDTRGKLGEEERKLRECEGKLAKSEQRLEKAKQARAASKQKLEKTERRLERSEQKLQRSEQKLQKTEQRLQSAQKTLNRKTVRPGVFIAKKLDALKKKPR